MKIMEGNLNIIFGILLCLQIIKGKKSVGLIYLGLVWLMVVLINFALITFIQ